jgi:histidine triad (HIT) family protein
MQSETIFSKIIRREIPATIVYESDKILAFRDISPKAPTHILIIPKKPLRDLESASKEDRELLGDLMLVAAEIARKENIAEGGYRVVINTGSDGGQTVFHLHLHLLGGRELTWPPG